MKLKHSLRHELPVEEFIRFNHPCPDRRPGKRGKLRLCTNPSCLWIGTRKQAVRGTRNDFRCPECMSKIQNDDELERNNPFKGFTLEEKILLLLYKKPGLSLSEMCDELRVRRRDLVWKVSEMLKEEKLQRIGYVLGPKKEKHFLDSGYLFRITVEHEMIT